MAYNLIECTNDNLFRKRRRKKNPFRFILTLILLVGLILYYKFVIIANLFTLCNDYAYSYSVDAVNSAVILSLENQTRYSDLVQIEKNSTGDIVLMNANSLKVNELSRNVAINSEKILSEKLNKGIPIPCMALTGIEFISGFGKTFNLKTLSVVSVSCDFISQFTSAGINQTLHEIYVEITCNIKIDFPLNEKKVIHTNKVLINQAIIVGKIPEVYLNGKLFG